jgi:hypothetical protein
LYVVGVLKVASPCLGMPVIFHLRVANISLIEENSI